MITETNINRNFCVAPMMGYTTPHARKLYRILSKKTFLFTEMIASKTMIYSNTKDLIIENDFQNPIALQVGGSETEELSRCASIAKSYNYDEINLNVGCPSKAVQKGSFGACLMKDKILVRNCLESMMMKNIEVSMKCRIGLGKEHNYDFFSDFISEVVKSGIKIIYIHARNAILNGVSPKDNRSIPPLNYNFVTQIKNDYPNTQFILNGGIDSIDKAYKLSQNFDGIMVGRLIQNNPFLLSKVDNLFYNKDHTNLVNKTIVIEYFEYIKDKISNDSIFRLLSPLLSLFFGVANSKKLKSEIQAKMKNKEIENLKSIFLKFLEEQENKN